MTHLPGCTGKQKYDTRATAKATAKKLRGMRGSSKLHVYECDWCAHWHLSSHATARAWARDRNAKLAARRPA